MKFLKQMFPPTSIFFISSICQIHSILKISKIKMSELSQQNYTKDSCSLCKFSYTTTFEYKLLHGCPLNAFFDLLIIGN